MSDFVARLGDALVQAAERQAATPEGWRGHRERLRARLPRRASTRALALVGAVGLVGAGGTAGLLAGRGEVGGPPSLTFTRVSPQQRAAGIEPRTRPVIFARGRLAGDGRPWQLVGFQTNRGLCIEIDWPRQHRAGGCGSETPDDGRGIDWQAQFAFSKGERGIVLGAVDPSAATVRLSYRHSVRQPPLLARTRVVHVRDRRLLAAMGLRRPFAYYLAEIDGAGAFWLRAEARDANDKLLGRAGIPAGMGDTSRGIVFRAHDGCQSPTLPPPAKARLVSTLPPVAVRSRLAVLRRPQRPSDLPPRWLTGSISRTPFIATIQVDAIRRLGTSPSGDVLYLVPTTGRALDFTPPPGCLRTLTPQQREREAMVQQRVDRSMTTLRLTLYSLDARGTGGSPDTFDLGQLRSDTLRLGSIGTQYAQIVPDGVATVELRFAGGLRRVATVQENVWAVRVPKRHGRARLPLESIWRDARGRVLRRFHR